MKNSTAHAPEDGSKASRPARSSLATRKRSLVCLFFLLNSRSTSSAISAISWPAKATVASGPESG